MADFIKGADLSSLLEVEECGGKFFDRGRESGAMEILKANGMNLVRLRLWNDPYSPDGKPYGAGTNDLARTMQLARRAQALGLPWLLDFHYSDFWADPGKQHPPKAWRGLSEEQLAQAVYEFTFKTMLLLKRADLLPAMVAPGNELSNGLLWPHGKTPNYMAIARFLSAAIRAIHEVAPGLPIMLHLDNGGWNGLYRSWFDSYLINGGVDFDYIGLSYYPFWHGTLDDLAANMNDLAKRYKKPMIVAETSIAYTLEDYARYEGLAPDERKGMATKPDLAAKVPYPMTEDGQCAFLRDLCRVLHAVPNGLGRGFIWWEPAWLPVPGSHWATPEALAYTGEQGPGGNEWANQALFDYAGNALPALQLWMTL